MGGTGGQLGSFQNNRNSIFYKSGDRHEDICCAVLYCLHLKQVLCVSMPYLIMLKNQMFSMIFLSIGSLADHKTLLQLFLKIFIFTNNFPKIKDFVLFVSYVQFIFSQLFLF